MVAKPEGRENKDQPQNSQKQWGGGGNNKQWINNWTTALERTAAQGTLGFNSFNLYQIFALYFWCC